MLEKKINLKAGKVGSALIMTVVLVVLLSIVAVMFVMVARMDSASTSNIVDSKTLDNAASSIIEIIGKELVFDTPGVAKNAGLTDPNYLDYQDYPDVNDAWLASIEPYGTGKTGKWRQISDVTGYLKGRNFNTQEIFVDPPGSSETIKDNTAIEVDEYGQIDEDYYDNSTNKYRANADADGDGIADSKWIELDGLNTSKGKKVFAAIRVIDNCAMLNVNTAYKFDANTADTNDIRYRIDGTNQMQINLAGILKGDDDIKKFHNVRCGVDAGNEYYNKTEQGWNLYNKDVIWDYGVPDGNYLPFDISDELELRYRYCIDGRFAGRIETNVNAMPNTTRGAGTKDFGNLYNTDSGWGLDDWQRRMTEPDYNDAPDRRHLLTTYSFDRLIDPDGNKMFNVRSDRNAQLLYNRLIGGIDHLMPDNPTERQNMRYYLAQIAANIVDYSDSDSNVSDVNVGSNHFFGYEPPFMFISEIARYFYQPSTMNPPSTDVNVYKSYAIELYKNFDKSQFFSGSNWKLIVNDAGVIKANIPLSSEDFNSQGGQYYVYILNNEKIESFQLGTSYTDSPANGAENVSSNVELSWPIFRILDANGNSHDATDYKLYLSNMGEEVGTSDLHYTGSNRKFKPGFLISEEGTYQWYVVGSYGTLEPKTRGVWEFTVGNPLPKLENVLDDINLPAGTLIELQRRNVGGSWITVDRVAVPGGDFVNETILESRSYQRDMRWNVYLKGLWSDAGLYSKTTLGHRNEYKNGSAQEIPPWHHSFTTVGDAAMVFYKSTYMMSAIDDTLRIRLNDLNANTWRAESEVRFDVNCPSMQNVFKYITALPPDGVSIGANETRVRGRININTAPAYVIAQLPWVSSKITNTDLKIADAIVAYRDKTKVASAPDPNKIDYSDRSDNKGTGITNVSESPGFSSVGELMNVINNAGIDYTCYNIRYCGIDGQLQSGYPGLYANELLYNCAPDSNLNDTDVQDDLEEKEMIFARISDLATVRSDTFTAYILVRVGVNGPQKRFIAILDRSGVKTADDPNNNRVKVAAFQQVPAAR